MGLKDHITSLYLHLLFVIKSLEIIHQHLGHPNLWKLYIMVLNLTKVSIVESESCQLGKPGRNFFHDKVNKQAAFHFTLVHLDIWDPSYVISTLGNTLLPLLTILLLYLAISNEKSF